MIAKFYKERVSRPEGTEARRKASGKRFKIQVSSFGQACPKQNRLGMARLRGIWLCQNLKPETRNAFLIDFSKPPRLWW
jgi:hypothetical protein